MQSAGCAADGATVPCKGTKKRSDGVGAIEDAFRWIDRICSRPGYPGLRIGSAKRRLLHSADSNPLPMRHIQHQLVVDTARDADELSRDGQKAIYESEAWDSCVSALNDDIRERKEVASGIRDGQGVLEMHTTAEKGAFLLHWICRDAERFREDTARMEMDAAALFCTSQVRLREGTQLKDKAIALRNACINSLKL